MDSAQLESQKHEPHCFSLFAHPALSWVLLRGLLQRPEPLVVVGFLGTIVAVLQAGKC
jgi:hypothetical protein